MLKQGLGRTEKVVIAETEIGIPRSDQAAARMPDRAPGRLVYWVVETRDPAKTLYCGCDPLRRTRAELTK